MAKSSSGMKRKSSGSAAASHGGHGAKRHRGNASAASNPNEKLYTHSDAILVLGDGDFSFSRGLVTHRGGGRSLCATSYDSELTVKSKYSNAAECIKAVRSAGATVLHGIDATKLHELPHRPSTGGNALTTPFFFQFIIFNFPHTGQQRVHLNRVLLLEFFESARDKLLKAGEVHITLKNRPPYSNWQVEDQAKAAGFVLKARRKFNDRLFPGYNHRTTDPQAKKFEAELCITYVFIVNRSKYPFDPALATQHVEDEAARASDATPDGSDTGEIDTALDLSLPVELGSPALASKKKNRKRRKTPAAPTAVLPLAQSSSVEPVERRRAKPFAWRPLHRRGVI